MVGGNVKIWSTLEAHLFDKLQPKPQLRNTVTVCSKRDAASDVSPVSHDLLPGMLPGRC